MNIFLDKGTKKWNLIKKELVNTKHVRSYEKCLELIQSEDRIGILFLDCSPELVNWIVENEPVISNIIIHISDSDSANEMMETLRNAKYRTSHLPFENMMDNVNRINKEKKSK